MIKLVNGELVGIVSKITYNNTLSILKEFDYSNIKGSLLYISLDRTKEEIKDELNVFDSIDKIILDNVDSNLDSIKNIILNNIDKIGLVIIDYFSLISLKNENDFSIISKFSKISRELKLLSLSIKQPIIVLLYVPDEVNLHNDVYPDLYDMRIFGAAESDVDLLITQFCYEGEYKHKVIKNRYGEVDT